MFDIVINVKKKEDIVDDFRYHEDDLKSQPTVFEQMMKAQQGESDSDEDEEDEVLNAKTEKVRVLQGSTHD